MTPRDDKSHVLFESTMLKKGRGKDWYKIVNMWSERRIQLTRGGEVLYFDGEKKKGSINIIGAQILERLPEQADGKNHAFEIVPENSKESNLIISANSQREREMWCQCLTYVSTGSWKKAKEAQNIREARTLPFPVHPKSMEGFSNTNESEAWDDSRRKTTWQSHDEELYLQQCGSHAAVWKNHLQPTQRRSLDCLATVLQKQAQQHMAAAQRRRDSYKLRSFSTKGGTTTKTALQRVTDDLARRKASSEYNITQFLGFPAPPPSSSSSPSAAATTTAAAQDDADSSSVHEQSEEPEAFDLLTAMQEQQKCLGQLDRSGLLNKCCRLQSFMKIRDRTHHIAAPRCCSVVITSRNQQELPQKLQLDGPEPETMPDLFSWARKGNLKAIQTKLSASSAAPVLVELVAKRDKDGLTMMHKTIRYGWWEILEYVLATVPAVDLRPHLAALSTAELTRQMRSNSISSIDSAGSSTSGGRGRLYGDDTLLHTAVMPLPSDAASASSEQERLISGQAKCMRILLEYMKKNASPAAVDINAGRKHGGWTPLHQAAWFGMMCHVEVLLEFLPPDGIAVAETAAAEGAEQPLTATHLLIDKRDIGGYTALHLAVAAGNLECVRALIERGRARVDMEGGTVGSSEASTAANGDDDDDDGTTTPHFTVFHLAAYSGHAAVLRYLLELPQETLMRCGVPTVEARAELTKRLHKDGTITGGAVAHFAALIGSVECLQVCSDCGLLEGAQLGRPPVSPRLAVPVVKGQRRASAAAAATASAASPLHFAAMMGHRAAVAFLLQKNANLSASDELGRTPAMAAALGGHADVLHMLVTAGATVQTVDHYGNTALHLAVGFNRLSVVKTLVENYGLLTVAANKDNLTTLALAQRFGHGELLRYLSHEGTVGAPWGDQTTDVIPEVTQAESGQQHEYRHQNKEAQPEHKSSKSPVVAAATATATATGDGKMGSKEGKGEAHSGDVHVEQLVQMEQHRDLAHHEDGDDDTAAGQDRNTLVPSPTELEPKATVT